MVLIAINRIYRQSFRMKKIVFRRLQEDQDQGGKWHIVQAISNMLRTHICTTCMFGKATKKPWRTKAPQNREQPSHTLTKPGDCFSVDQLESSIWGLIGQLRGIPTIERYEVATVFIDHYSGLGYAVHLQKSTTAIETERPRILLSATPPCIEST